MKTFLFIMVLIVMAGSYKYLFPKERKLMREVFNDSKPIYKGSFGKAFDHIKDEVVVKKELKSLVTTENTKNLKNVQGWGTLSLKIADKDLHGDRGIFTHYKERGPLWERVGHLTYLENGKEQYSDYVGIRLHGGASRVRIRLYDDLLGSLNGKKFKQVEKRSLRVYFKKKYGKNEFYNDFKFENNEIKPLRRMVIHHDLPKVFMNDFTYWFARKIGALAPETKPILYYLNNKFEGYYFLVEHVARKHFEEKLGHKKFRFYRFKSSNEMLDKIEYKKLQVFVKYSPKPINYEKLKERIDIKNYMASIFPYLFLGITDWFQGAMIKEEVGDNNKWYWYNWDMDHAIWSRTEKYGTNNELWQERGLDLMLKKNGSVLRSKILRRLWKESPEFKKEFQTYCKKQIDWIKSKEYLERINLYRNLAKAAGRYTANHLDVMEEYMEKRISWFEKHLAKELTR